MTPFSIAMVDQSQNETTNQENLGFEKALKRYQAKFISHPGEQEVFSDPFFSGMANITFSKIQLYKQRFTTPVTRISRCLYLFFF